MTENLSQMKRHLHDGIAEYKRMITAKIAVLRALERGLAQGGTYRSNMTRVAVSLKRELQLLADAMKSRETAIVIISEIEIALEDKERLTLKHPECRNCKAMVAAGIPNDRVNTAHEKGTASAKMTMEQLKLYDNWLETNPVGPDEEEHPE